MSSVTTQNTRLGIWLMIATSVVFAAQDGISRHLATNYSVMMVVMIVIPVQNWPSTFRNVRGSIGSPTT